MAISGTSLLLSLAFGAILWVVSACYSTRAVSPDVSVHPLPRVVPERPRVTCLSGIVYRTPDSTTVVPGLELVFRSQGPDSTSRMWRTLTAIDGGYAVALPAGRTYRVAWSKDGQTQDAQTLVVDGTPLDSARVRHHFYVPYSDGCCSDSTYVPSFYFDTNSAVLRPYSVARFEAFFHSFPSHAQALFVFVVEGHAEPGEVPRHHTAKAQYLQWLALERAKNVCDYLHKKGVASTQLYLVSRGDKLPGLPNTSPEYRQFNRRVVIRPRLLSEGLVLDQKASYNILLQRAKKSARPFKASRAVFLLATFPD